MELGDDVIHKQEDLPNNCYQIFREMRRKKEFCDITLNIGNDSIYAHKVIVAASIPYFRSLFGDAAMEGRQKEISLSDVNCEALESLIDFAYTCELKITSANVQMLLIAACFLEMDKVKHACVEFIIKGISPLNAISIRDIALRMNCVELVNLVDEYVKKHFDEVSRLEEFALLPYWCVKDLVCSNDLYVSNEEKVFEAVIRWVKARSDERITKLPGLLSCVRMPFVKLYYLKDAIATNELIKDSIQCRDILDDARDYHLFPEKRYDGKTTWKFECTPRLYRTDNENPFFAVRDKLLFGRLKEESTVQVKNPVPEFSGFSFGCSTEPFKLKLRSDFTQAGDRKTRKACRRSNISLIRNQQRHLVKPTFFPMEAPVAACEVKREIFCPDFKMGTFNFSGTWPSHSMSSFTEEKSN